MSDAENEEEENQEEENGEEENQENLEEEHPEEEEEPEEEDPTPPWKDRHPLTQEFMDKGLSEIVKTIDGKGYAFSKLDLKKKRITSVGEIISKFPHLRTIDFSRNKLKEISQLSTIDSLLYLTVAYNQIESLPRFPQLHFQILIASHNRIADIKESGSDTIVSINLDYNKLKDIEGIDHFPKLRTAYFRQNKLKSTAHIGSLPDLEQLYLDDNRLRHAVELEQLPSLKELSLNNNPNLKKIDGILAITSLVSLSMNNTGIEEIEEVKKFQALPNLKKLSFIDSPVTGADNYRQEVLILLPKLESLDDERFTEEERNEKDQVLEERAEEKRQQEEEERQRKLEEEEERKREEEEERQRKEEEEAERKRQEEEEKQRQLEEEEERKRQEEEEARLAEEERKKKAKEDGEEDDEDEDE